MVGVRRKMCDQEDFTEVAQRCALDLEEVLDLYRT
jgi:hypothetical protein